MSHQLKPRLVWILILVLASSPVLVSALAPAAPSAYDPNVLSYGLYWFGLNDVNQKFVSGETNAYFDPTKPTLIFVHGWQPGISATYPPNFTYNYMDVIPKSVNTANAWIEAGWNVGIFFWNQFSDETAVTDAEAKIWVNDGPQNMRWRKGDGSYEEAPAGTLSAAELFYEEYVAAMTEYEYTGDNIRIAGHSLGNQMATRLTKLVNDGITAGVVPEPLRPTRVALLDPYWSTDAQTYLDNRKTGTIIREYIAELLPTGTLFEWYWSSVLTIDPNGDTNNALKPMMMYAKMSPVYEPNDMSKHCAAYHLYFWSYDFPAPSACTGDDCLNMDMLLAKMSDAQLAAVMRSDYRWEQVAGQTTATLNDDVYASTLQAGAPYTVTQLQANPPIQTSGGVITVTATVTGTGSPAADGTLVTFGTDLGTISARSVTSGGVAVARITSAVAGTAHISATAQGAGGTVQSTAVVTFTDCPVPLTDARIDGPVGVTGTLYIETSYTFNAIVTPTSATPAITYTWSPTPTNGQNHPNATYQWPVPGTYTITLTAENCGGSVDAAPRVIHIAHQEWKYIYLPLVVRNHN